MESTYRQSPQAGGISGEARDLGSGIRAFLGLDEVPSEEVRRGQIVLVIARWVLIGVGMFLTMSAPANLFELQVSIVGLLGMAVINFWLHINLVLDKPASQQTLFLASIADVGLISAIVALAGGFDSYTFVFYYTAAIAFSLVFPPRHTVFLTLAMVALYAAVVLAVSSEALQADADTVFSTMRTRITTLLAVVTIASLYKGVDRQRQEDEPARQS